MKEKMNGFTLVEVMIVVVILGILAAFALPSYQNSVTKTKRTEGKALLLEAAQEQEKIFTQSNAYSTDITDFTADSDNGYYKLSFSASSATSFTFAATPQSPFSDTDCGNLTLTNTGIKGVSGTASVAECW